MSEYLIRLIEKSRGDNRQIRPRPPSLFEPARDDKLASGTVPVATKSDSSVGPPALGDHPRLHSGMKLSAKVQPAGQHQNPGLNQDTPAPTAKEASSELEAEGNVSKRPKPVTLHSLGDSPEPNDQSSLNRTGRPRRRLRAGASCLARASTPSPGPGGGDSD